MVQTKLCLVGFFLLCLLNLGVSERRCGGTDTYCLDSHTCCEKDGDWGCCPYRDATCCPDKVKCCPSGYVCGASTCYRKIIRNNNTELLKIGLTNHMAYLMDQKNQNQQKKTQNNTNLLSFIQGILLGLDQNVNVQEAIQCLQNGNYQDLDVISNAFDQLMNTTQQQLEVGNIVGDVLKNLPKLFQNCSGEYFNLDILEYNWKDITNNIMRKLLNDRTHTWKDFVQIQQLLATGKWEQVGYVFGNVITRELKEPVRVAQQPNIQ